MKISILEEVIEYVQNEEVQFVEKNFKKNILK